MNISITVNHKQLLDVLLNVGLIRPVFIWGAPGIGKSAIVQEFADSLGLECISLLGSQLAPEDIIGVPQIKDGFSQFCPPRTIARAEPYVLFLDELNACTSEVQKAFYSLIHERRIGEYHLPEGSIVVGAGNRAQDNAITRPMSSALINRMFHVELTASPGCGWSGPLRTASIPMSTTIFPAGPTTCGPSLLKVRSPSPLPAPGTCSATPSAATDRASERNPCAFWPQGA